jgi:hypothetical protein
MKSQTRVGNIRRWLRRPDCPDAIREVKALFDKAFVPANATKATEEREFKGSRQAFVRRGNAYFSPATTHEGNATVFYRPRPESEPVAGQIECIERMGHRLKFRIRQYLPIHPSTYDPFKRYPDFSARTFSSDTKTISDDVSIEDIIGHAARFDFSQRRSVFCDLSRT